MAAKQGYFITGTDTDVGKTYITVRLLQYFRRQGFTAMGMKPVASGCARTDEGLRNDDALQLQAHSSLPVSYEVINPFAYEPPVSPNIAAARSDRKIDLSVINENYLALQAMADRVLVEGVGGWLVPLADNMDVSDMARSLGLPVILIVGVRLGCINHTRLTCEAIRLSGLPFAGWVANCRDRTMLKVRENIDTIAQYIEAPLLGILPFNEGENTASDFCPDI